MCLQRMVPDQEARRTINCEMEMYRNANGLFGFDTVVQERKILTPSKPSEFRMLILCFISKLKYIFFISYLNM